MIDYTPNERRRKPDHYHREKINTPKCSRNVEHSVSWDSNKKEFYCTICGEVIKS